MSSPGPMWYDNPVISSWRAQTGRAKVTVDREFFLSFTGADRPWAEWLLAELDTAGYSSVSQLRDFVAGTNFALAMDAAARRARRTLGVLSPMALEARFVRQEWAQRLAADPTGERRALVLVRVEPCEPEGLLGPVVYIDLVGLDEASARQQLREELAAVVRGERRLLADPSFPGGRSAPVARGMRGPRFPTALPPTWNVPFRRNPDFTGREEALDDLANQLGQNAATAVTQALQGGGGVGKTALAVEYAYRYRSRFETVWWVRAEEPTTVVGDYANLAAALKLPEADGADQQQAAKVVHAWLDENDRWLLILDNAQGPDTPTGLPAPLARLVDLIPQVLHGQALVTSRDASWEEYGALAELEVFSFEEAVAFLLARTGSNDQAAATEISELLGLLPLALEQAGAYVRETRLSLSAYLDRLRHYPALTITRGRPRDRDPADTVATTWELSLERVRSTPGAVALLEVCAFLDPEEIPRELLSRQLDPPAEELAPLADPFTLDKAVAAVRRFGLVKASEETLSVHRLLQQVIRDQLDPAARTARAATAVRLLAVALPFTDYADPRQWPAAARLVPHGLAAADNANQLKVEPMLTASLLGSAADYLQSRARHGEARSLRERSLTIFEAHLGPDHPDTLTARHTLASARGRAGDAAGAVTALKELVQDYERIFGPDHPRTLAARHGLARWQRRAGDAAGAVAALRELVQDYERVFGPDHHDTLAARDNLARSQGEAGDAADAVAALQELLEDYARVFGRDHPKTLTARHSLASARGRAGDAADAVTALEELLEDRRRILGPDHPDTLATRHSLARWQRRAGDAAGAVAALRELVQDYERVFGPDHHDTLAARDNLARSQDRFTKPDSR